MANERKTYPSSKEAKKRCVHSYLSTKYHSLTIGYAERNEMRKSEVVKLAVKEFFDRMPKHEQERLMTKPSNHY